MAAPPWKADFPSRPPAITSGTFFPNRMIAWVISNTPAIPPPTPIASNAFFFIRSAYQNERREKSGNWRPGTGRQIGSYLNSEKHSRARHLTFELAEKSATELDVSSQVRQR